MPKKVLVGMSGGVDSSVAALLLRDQGYDVHGVFMMVWDTEDPRVITAKKTCYSIKEKDLEDAKQVAKKLDIPFYTVDVSQDYKNEVLDYFSEEYSAGKTPNPCVECNKKIKFGTLIKKMAEMGQNFDFYATGHYARLRYNEKLKIFELLKGKDLAKDQSYFLYKLDQSQISKCIFPLGDYTKSEVKEIALKYGLEVAKKAESQNFVDGDYSYLINEQQMPGDFLDDEGNIIGKHKGIAYYTIGQRKGLMVFRPEPLYVIKIDKTSNTITLGSEQKLYSDWLFASEVNWLSIERPATAIKAMVKIRYATKEVPATIVSQENGVKVFFDIPIKSIAPGQGVVFYSGDVLLGGGTIV